MTGYEHIEHTFAPVYDADSLVLILGTLPSVVAAAVILLLVFPHCAGWQVLPWGGRLRQ